jgi:hypothetical protein
MEFMQSPEENQLEWRFSLIKKLLDGNIRMNLKKAVDIVTPVNWLNKA